MLKPTVRFSGRVLFCVALLFFTFWLYFAYFPSASPQEKRKIDFMNVINKIPKLPEVAVIPEEALIKVGGKSVRGITKCRDFDVVKHVNHRRSFYVLTNFVQAEKKYRCHESVTFASPADFSFLDNLEPLVEGWQAPVSVALYTPGYDFEIAMDSINFLRDCKSPLIKEYVTFHFFFDEDHLPEDAKYSKPANCEETPPYAEHESYKNAMNLTFPINIARNVAKEEAQTHFVMIADIELIPTPNFVEKFLDMVLDRPELFDDGDEDKNAFVLPIFEVPENEVVPETKTQLQAMFSKKRAFLFHQKLCKICHQVPEGGKWLAANETEFLDVFAVGKRVDTFKMWEPFYVATKDVPNFDERLSWEGQRNKMTQAYLMCVMDYNYMILNNAFLVHKPGIKKEKTQLVKYEAVVRKTNRMIRNAIKVEYNIVYGTKKGCFL